ncbi:MAG: DNA polymerase III subunit chi [Alphaproteobacteria bacterium]|jgi:DNA polymerase-3 subunit chi|nr:DNA polymerase III subunit chi [Alphaproteobacteria bacterium]
MTEVRFYHLQRTGLERALPQLLGKTLERGWRAVVMAGSEDRVEALNNLLWTYSREGFLPHGNKQDGHAEDQPVWLTEADENPNGANVLFLVDGAESAQVGDYELCCEMFDGNDEVAVERARGHWTACQEAGHKLTYWQQNDRGAWEEKANAGG